MNITRDSVTYYINGFYAPLSKELEKLRNWGEENSVPIILRETESFLGTLLELKKPKRILEIGTAIGYSSIFFHEKSKAEVISIEKSEEMAKIASENIKKMGMESHIKVMEGDGEEVIEYLIREKCSPFDMIFIDAAKSHYLRFFKSAIKLAQKGTVIISDNILMKAMTCDPDLDKYKKHKTNIRNMREYIEYITDLEGAETCLTSIGDGIAITTLK